MGRLLRLCSRGIPNCCQNPEHWHLYSLMARIGGILAPQMTYLANLWLPAPFAAVAAVGFVSLVVSWKFLPDTKGQELFGEIEEIEEENQIEVAETEEKEEEMQELVW